MLDPALAKILLSSCPSMRSFSNDDLVSKFPDAIMEIRKAIKACIEKYEPRLRNVRVEHVPDEENPLSLRYDITAQLFIEETKSKVWFETTLDSDGHVRVRG